MIAPSRLPGSLAVNSRLDRWLRFNADRTVTVTTGKVEIGQGILTVMAQIAAEELGVEIARIRVVSGDTEHTPDEGQTSASRSVNEGGVALRYACAEVRSLLMHEAVRRLDIEFDRLTVVDGIISEPGGPALFSYWDLPHAALMDAEATASVAPAPARGHTIVGSSTQRLDIPDKVMGKPRYIQDFEVPGMLFGRVVRPPAHGAQLTGFDADAVQCLPGVIAVVRDGNFIGVVAQREEQAVKARLAAISAAQWEVPPLVTDAAGIRDFLLSRETENETVMYQPVSDEPAPGRRRFEAQYSKPYIAHASIGPSCALARMDEGRVEVWSQTQGVFPLRYELALILGMLEHEIVIHHVEGAGCYGHNGADDVALDAVLLSRAVDGRPVQVQWMRDDEFAWEPYGPAMAMTTSGALDADGNVVEWSHEVWSNGHIHRPGSVRDGGRVSSLLAAWHLAEAVPRAPQWDACQANIPGSGCIGRNVVALYDFPHQRVVTHRVKELPLRVSSLRSTGGYANLFAIESFMDELAAAAGADPVEFRLRNLNDPRARAVIELATSKANWQPGAVSDGMTGRGMAFARLRNRYAYFAVVVDIGLDPDLHVKRVVAAIDVGQAINPDGVINQTEGGIMQAISWTLKEQVRFDKGGIISRSWEDYPILTFPEVPQVEVHLINRPEEEPLGAGEAMMGPTGAAIANALYHALGIRIRDLPITRERIVAAG
jgi:nicotinate dehydrogenase subunit B